MSREQLIEIILNTYGSSADAKAYLEFFLNPDAAKLIESKAAVCAKELNRTKWGYSKARVSVLKQQLKEAAAFGIDNEHLAKLAYTILIMLLDVSQYYYFTESHSNAIGYFASEYFNYKAEDGEIEDAMKNINKIVNNFNSAHCEKVKTAVADAANKLKILISFKS